MDRGYDDNVFINCPFDLKYKRIFDAIVFGVHDAGFIARCAQEVSDASRNRLGEIMRIISECRYGVHDISRTELDPKNRLPRFNMPFELGISLAAERFGRETDEVKPCLVMDREPYRYQKFLSDIAGQDVKSHGNKAQGAVSQVRKFLRTESGRVNIPGEREIWNRFKRFEKSLPLICAASRIKVEELTFVDYTYFVVDWLESNP
jgi:hypothetical protein